MEGARSVRFQDVGMVRMLVRRAVEHAGRAGVKTTTLASRLDIMPSTLGHWTRPSEADRTPTSGAFYSMLTRVGVLPEAARVELVMSLLDAAGFEVVERGQQDRAPVVTQVLEHSSAAGKLAEMAAMFASMTSRGGVEITASEAREMLDSAREAVREAGQLVETLKRIAGGGA